MDSIGVNRSEVVGKKQNNTAVLEALISTNALNCTGDLNYNENGKLDGVGFEKISEKFINNFILKVLVPDYNTEKEREQEICLLPRKIRQFEIC